MEAKVPSINEPEDEPEERRAGTLWSRGRRGGLYRARLSLREMLRRRLLIMPSILRITDRNASAGQLASGKTTRLLSVVIALDGNGEMPRTL